jgi:hypothetical protein
VAAAGHATIWLGESATSLRHYITWTLTLNNLASFSTSFSKRPRSRLDQRRWHERARPRTGLPRSPEDPFLLRTSCSESQSRGHDQRERTIVRFLANVPFQALPWRRFSS